MESSDTPTLERLQPSEEMRRLLTPIEATLNAIEKNFAAAPQVVDWTPEALVPLTESLAYFALIEQGFDLDSFFTLDFENNREALLDELSFKHEIMSQEDLEDRVHALLENSVASRRFRDVAETLTLKELLKKAAPLSWTGFSIEHIPEDERVTIEREKMFVDYFRDRFDGSFLRAPTLSSASALVYQAHLAGLINEKDRHRLLLRVATESIVRFSCWSDWFQSLLLTTLFLSLERSSVENLNLLIAEQQRLKKIAPRSLAAHPWLCLKKEN